MILDRIWPALVALALCAGSGPGQSFPSMNGTWRVAGLRTGDPCAGSALALTALSGTMSFQANGGFSWSIDESKICGGTSSRSTDAGTGGAYEIDTDGTIDIEWNVAPRADSLAHTRPDGDVFVVGPHDAWAAATTLVAIRTGGGLGNATMSGGFHILRLVYEQTPSGFTVRREFGTATFGATTWTEDVETFSIPSPSTGRVRRAGMPFSVSSQGELSFGSSAVVGVVSASGEIATWVTSVGQRTEWVVALRAGSSRDAGLVDGPWGVVGHGLAVDPGPGVDYAYTQFGDVEVRAFAANSATYRATIFDRDTGFGGIFNGSYDTTRGSFVFALDPAVAAGRFAVSVDGFGAPPLWRAAVSRRGEYLVTSLVDDGANEPEVLMQVALRTVRWPTRFGAGTPGAGGRVPELEGYAFPYLGNGSFSLRVEAHASATSAFVALAFGPGATPLAGGHLWIDLASVAVLSVPCSSGVGFVPLPLPVTPSLSGTAFYAQALVPTAGAPLGLALSNGLRVELGR